MESKTEKGRGSKTINVIACDQDKNKILRISLHGCRTFLEKNRK